MKTLSAKSKAKRLYLLGAALLGFALPAAGQTTVTSTIAAPLDDMEEYVSGGNIDWNSSDLELVNEGGGDQLIGLRFTNLNIPQGAGILKAYIQFTADNTHSGSTTLKIEGEASDDAASFPNQQYSVSPRVRTKASATWVVDPWTTVQERDAAQRSSDIRNVIQEIVNRPGFTSSSALALIITGSGKREAESYEGANAGDPGHAANQAATLVVEWTTPTKVTSVIAAGLDDMEEYVTNGSVDNGSSDLELVNESGGDQLVGLRFTNLKIPQGAIILNSYLQFTADNTHSGVTELKIYGQAADDAAQFQDAQFTVSSRAKTTENVSWTVDAWNVKQEQSTAQRSPDISEVVQAIVNRPGWSTTSSMGIIITGSGKREAESYEGANSSDAGHDASQAPNLVVEYIVVEKPKAPVGSYPISKTAVWRYLDNGTNQGTAWKDSAFDDKDWAFGPGELGYGDGDEATVVGFGGNASNKHITTYFRHVFTVEQKDLDKIDSLSFGLVRDDGAVVYVNGTEVYRSNMPTGTITYQTPSAGNTGSETALNKFTIAKSLLAAGKRNVIAVEVHQDNGTSSDVSFYLTMSGFKSDKKVVTAGSEWKYNDKGANLGLNWKNTSYDDASWKSGNAVLGFGNGDETTMLDGGSNPAERPVTYYFRKAFNVSDTGGYSSMVLNLKRDDGAIVYLNGAEVYRSNMPLGGVNYKTTALQFVEGAEEDMWVSAVIAMKALRTGMNTVAVEVHQNSHTSTDLRFDLELTLPGIARPITYIRPNVTCDPASSTHIACFTSVNPAGKGEIAVFPSTHAFQLLMKSLTDTFTDGSKTIPNGNDFTGFIPDNGSSVKGWLSVNHENSPGGVSILDIHFDEKTGLWVVDEITPVDFSPVVQTVRNCSGGVTPWGTVITSEETFNAGDANSDGYQDVGWQVEIDPKTKKIRDYDNDGKPDKLWAMGRMSHENIVVSKDGVTAYQGEDGGTNCVYKFVADKKNDLSAGTLYALKRDNSTSTTGTWVKVPNGTQAERNTARDVAKAVGGTAWSGVEDVEIGPDGMIYFTAKGPGHVWRFKDEGTTVSNLEIYVAGNSNFDIAHENGDKTESYRTGNDNLDFDDEGNLWILQDGGEDHIWVARNGHSMANPMIEVFNTSPIGSEPTGITFSPDYKFMFLSFQNASSTNKRTVTDAAGRTFAYNSSVTMVVARKEFLGTAAGEDAMPTVSLGNDTTICEGQELTLKATVTDGVAIWNDGSTGSTLTVDESGKYFVTVKGNNGMEASDSINVTVSPLPEPFIGNDTFICKTCSFVLDAGPGSSYKWSTGATTQKITVSQAGKYSVAVKNANGCEGTDAINVYELPTSGMKEIKTDRFAFAVYPNPFVNEANIKLDLSVSADVKVTVHDVTGKQVAVLASGPMSGGNHVLKFDRVSGGSQVFFVSMEIDNKTYTLRLIQQ